MRFRRAAKTPPAPRLDMWCEFPACDERAVEIAAVATGEIAAIATGTVYLALCPLHRSDLSKSI